MPILGLENVTKKINKGLVHSGTIGALLRDFEKLLRDDDIGLYFDSSEMVIYKKGEKKESVFGITRITSNSGLISLEKITNAEKEDDKKRIAVTSLLRPEIKPNMVINVEKGVYIIEKFEHVGDTFGGDFLSNIEAVE